jgi:hypothetical protein
VFVLQGEFPLLWKGVEIIDIAIVPEMGGSENVLKTFFSQRKFELSPGVEGIMGGHDHDDGDKKICATHLAHEPFYFKIVIVRVQRG